MTSRAAASLRVALPEDRAEGVALERRGDGDRVGPELVIDDLGRVALYDGLAGQALEEHEPPREQVRARRGIGAAPLLGRGVAGRAEDSLFEPVRRAAPSPVAPSSDRADAEVEDERVPPGARRDDHDVRWA